mgnify:FL=1
MATLVVLPDSGSYSITRPANIPNATWTSLPHGDPSGSSPKHAFESGDESEMRAYFDLFTAAESEATASYSVGHIQAAVDWWAAIIETSGYAMTGSLQWKDNGSNHPLSD